MVKTVFCRAIGKWVSIAMSQSSSSMQWQQWWWYGGREGKHTKLGGGGRWKDLQLYNIQQTKDCTFYIVSNNKSIFHWKLWINLNNWHRPSYGASDERVSVFAFIVFSTAVRVQLCSVFCTVSVGAIARNAVIKKIGLECFVHWSSL